MKAAKRWMNCLAHRGLCHCSHCTPQNTVSDKVYGLDEEPTGGHFKRLVNTYGHVVYWTGKRWWDPRDSDGSLQTQEAWPPDPNDFGGAEEWWWVP